MKFIKSKKGPAVLAAFVVIAAAAGGAYGYFTSTGSGSGNATVGVATNWTVAGGSVVGTLYPGAAYGTASQGVVTGASVTNASTTAKQNLNKIIATISGVTTGVGAGPACAVTDFQFNSPLLAGQWSGSGTQTATILPNVDLDPGASYAIANLNVAMVDNGLQQDNCQGQTVTVTFNAS